MVLVNDPFERTVQIAIEHLTQHVCQVNQPGELAGLLAAHFLGESRWQGTFSWRVFLPPDEWLSQHDADRYDAPQLAVLGSLLFELCRRGEDIPDPTKKAFVDGVERLRERKNVFSVPNSWAIQPNIVLGVALGITAADALILRNWMQDRLQEGFGHLELPYFLRLCYIYGLSFANRQFDRNIAQHFLAGDGESLTIPELSLAIWLVTHETLFVQDAEIVAWLDKVQPVLLED